MLCPQRCAMLTAIVQQNIYAHKYCVELWVLVLFTALLLKQCNCRGHADLYSIQLITWRNYVTCQSKLDIKYHRPNLHLKETPIMFIPHKVWQKCIYN